VPHRFVHPFAQAIASGSDRLPGNGPVTPSTVLLAHSAFISGLNEILLVASFVLFGGAVLALVLVRQRDFVASSPEAAAAGAG